MTLILTRFPAVKARQLESAYPATEAVGSSLNGVVGTTGSAVGTAESTVGGAAGTAENLLANPAGRTSVFSRLNKMYTNSFFRCEGPPGWSWPG